MTNDNTNEPRAKHFSQAALDALTDSGDDTASAVPGPDDATVLLADAEAAADPADAATATTLMPADADAAATTLMPADAGVTRQADADATRLADADATLLNDAAPTTVVPEARPMFEDEDDPDYPDATDGIDAMDDPYASILEGDELTDIQAPVAIAPPTESYHKKSRPWVAVLALVVALALGGGAAWYTYQHEYWGGHTLPDVVGLTEADARAQIEGLGFAVEVTDQLADDGIGTVLWQSPEGGIRTETTQPVTIAVATARTIPDVVGKNVDDARQALLDVGAANITIAFSNSTLPAGQVISVTPEAGATFVSADPVTLTVAQAYKVPDVTGMTVDEATAVLQQQGLLVKVDYINSEGEKGKVAETDPAANTEITPGSTVTLKVPSPYPADFAQVVEYFGIPRSQLGDFVRDQGFSLVTGARAESGNLEAVYQDSNGNLLRFTDEPWSSDYEVVETPSDPLDSAAPIGGIRLKLAVDALPAACTQVSEAGVRAVMEHCGLMGLTSTATEDDIHDMLERQLAGKGTTATTTDGAGGAQGGAEGGAGEAGGATHADEGAERTSAAGLDFVCGSGEQDGYVWTVLIGGYPGAFKVVVTAAPKSVYDAQDLSDFGGSVAEFVAYGDFSTE